MSHELQVHPSRLQIHDTKLEGPRSPERTQILKNIFELNNQNGGRYSANGSASGMGWKGAAALFTPTRSSSPFTPRPGGLPPPRGGERTPDNPRARACPGPPDQPGPGRGCALGPSRRRGRGCSGAEPPSLRAPRAPRCRRGEPCAPPLPRPASVTGRARARGDEGRAPGGGAERGRGGARAWRAAGMLGPGGAHLPAGMAARPASERAAARRGAGGGGSGGGGGPDARSQLSSATSGGSAPAPMQRPLAAGGRARRRHWLHQRASAPGGGRRAAPRRAGRGRAAGMGTEARHQRGRWLPSALWALGPPPS